jgi:hypothetical protein
MATISQAVVGHVPNENDVYLKIGDRFFSTAALNSIATLMFWNQTNKPLCSMPLITQNNGEPIVDNTGTFIEGVF